MLNVQSEQVNAEEVEIGADRLPKARHSLTGAGKREHSLTGYRIDRSINLLPTKESGYTYDVRIVKESLCSSKYLMSFKAP